MFGNTLHNMFMRAMRHNRDNILALTEKNPEAVLLDLGCDDGVWTMELAGAIGTSRVHGIDIVEERLEQAAEKGVGTVLADLKKPLDMLEDDSFDVIHANQVIEHVPDVDLFAGEIFRICKPGGYALLSTENGSSWCNVLAASMGWQLFSSTNISGNTLGIGNPLAIHRGTRTELISWTHKTIFHYRGLVEFLAAHGFTGLDVRGAGYFPLPTRFGDIDRRHAHFLTVKARKPRAVAGA